MIRLRELTIREAPGLPDGVALSSLDPGLNLVWGPNASGKSTLARVLLGTLWPDPTLGNVLAEVVLDEDGRELRAVLRFGSVRWEPDPPALPPAEIRSLLALDLRSLLKESTADAGFSRRVTVELMAGYDLDAALASLEAPTPRKGPLQKRLNDARTELRRLEHKAEDLARQEEELNTLRQRQREAKQAVTLAQLAEDATRLAAIRAEIDALRARRDALPPGLDRLQGDEAEELERLETALESARARVAELTERRRHAREQADSLRLPKRQPESHELTAWRERVRELGKISRTLDDRRERAAEARGRLEAAARGLGTWDPPPQRLDTDALSTLEAALGRRESLRARVHELEAAVALWSAQAGNDEATGADRLETGLDALRSWLRAAPVERIPRWPGWLAVAAGGIMAALRTLPPPPPLPPGPMAWLATAGLLVLGLGAGYLTALTLVRRVAGGTAEARRRAAEAGLEPDSWEQPAVLDRLREAETERARRLQDEEAARRGADARRELAQRQEELETAGNELRDLAASLGLAPDLPDLALAEAAGRIRSWIEAHDELAGLEGRLDEAGATLRVGLEELGRWLGELGLEPAADAAAATALVDELAGRLKDFERLTQELAQREDDLRDASRDENTARQALDAFWERAGIDPGDTLELRRRLGLLPEHGKLDRELRDRLAVAASTEAGLDGEGAWERLGLDRETFTEEQARELAGRHAEEGSRYEEIVAEIKEIEAAVRQAESGSSLEEARARVAEAAQAIAEHRDRAMETVLARLLVERAREAQRRDHAPRVLQRAQSWFTAFTRGSFRLEVGSEGAFSAIDTSTGQRRSLDQLSDGTRIHLLLAARLAAIEETEGAAGPLPLVLDEALSTTDPGRFGEIAGALLELIRNGRQILYLTADPDEVAQWRRACEQAGVPVPEPLTLGPPPEAAAGWAGVERLDAGTIPDVPPPDGLDTVAWARQLGVPAPDPWRPSGDWHVLHLLPDRLPLVYDLLQLGFERTGPLQEALGAGGLDGILDPAGRALLRARTCLLEAALELRNEGRGRPVTWEDVEASGAVSPTFEEAVKGLVEAEGRNPRAFLDAVGALRGFRRAKLDQLEAHLEATGILPSGEPLPDELVAGRAAQRCRDVLEAAQIDPAEAVAFVRSILNLSRS